MDDPLTPMVAPPPLPGSTPGVLKCAICLYLGPTTDPEVVTIMAGYATCRSHMGKFDSELQRILHPSITMTTHNPVG